MSQGIGRLQAAQRMAMPQVIPAQAGTYILHVAPAGDLVVREPVIAWAVSNLRHVHPITSTGFKDDLEYDPLIEHPDGTLQDILGIYGSYADWRRDYRAQRSIEIFSAEAAKRPRN